MSTDAQRAANRANSSRSTGPRTDSADVAERPQPPQLVGGEPLLPVPVGSDGGGAGLLAPPPELLGEASHNLRVLGREVGLVEGILHVVVQLEAGPPPFRPGAMDELPAAEDERGVLEVGVGVRAL